ncbi:hypothetical protein [Caballeronia sp. KNU42]
MKHSDFFAAIQQLCAAADILSRQGPQEWQLDAFRLLSVFRRYNQSNPGLQPSVAFDDELFMQTAQAALTMAGRNEFAASHALLQQANSLLPPT